MKPLKFTTLVFALLLGAFTARAQSSCPDLNGYVDSKNIPGTGYFTLQSGLEEKAAQTYHYSGPGNVSKVRVYGNSITGFVPLRVTIYNVDANGRPTTEMQHADPDWYWFNNTGFGGNGYIDVSFGTGVPVASNFAVGVSLRSTIFYTSFGVKYTGNGENQGEDLASLAGTSTGGNWASADAAFAKDGDFYIVPEMTNFVNAGFTVASQCVSGSSSVVFTNTTEMSKDSMFNIIGWSLYSGTNWYYTWNFGDGSSVSHDVNPSHYFASPGVYSVSLTATVEGWNGACTATYSLNISVGLSASTTSVVNVLCNAESNGAFSAVGTGGATPYSYSINGITYQQGAIFSTLPAGIYTAYVKDNLGCVSTATATITQPGSLVFATPQTTNANCGNSDGQILVSASGGTGAKQYRLNNGTFSNSGLFSGLGAGAYQITVKDAVQCTATITVVVSNQTAPVISVVNSTNVSCNGGNDGSITLGATGGGTGTLQYSVNGGVSFQTNPVFTGLTAGSYGVLVKDQTGCSSGTTVILTQPSSITFVVSSLPVSCNGGANGQITVSNAVGGIGILSYSVNGVNYQSNSTFSNLSAATYSVSVKDIAGCTATKTVTVTQPAAISATATVTSPGCNDATDGRIVVTATGGVGGYMYSLNNVNYRQPSLFLNVGAGTYTVYVKDRNNCSFSFNTTVTEPTPVVATVQTTNSTCGNSNGAILVTASGGSGAGYQFSTDGVTFSGGGSFSNLASGTYYFLVVDGAGCRKVVSGTITDSNGPTIGGTNHTNVSCNGGNDGTINVTSVTGGTGTLQYSIDGIYWQPSATFSGLDAGSYTVIVKDANGCTGEVNVALTQPAPFSISNSVTNVTCYGENSGRVTITAIGGAGTLAYSLGGISFQGSNVFNNLTAGNYQIVVRDAAGCAGVASAVITQPTQISILTAALNVTCANAQNGLISVLATGGVGTAEYSLDGATYQTSGTFENLEGGVYIVYVRDDNQCVKAKSVTVTEPTLISLTTNVSDVSCAGGNNGFINLSSSGGVGPYTYQWSNGTKNEDLFNLPSGSYTATVTDNNGCTAAQSATVTQPAMPLIVNGTVTGSTGNNGAVDITITGGTSPYFYNWSGGAVAEDLTGLTAGTYTVEVTDINGCATSNTFTVPSLTGIVNPNGEIVSIEVYPNPASQQVNVRLTGTEVERLRITDMLGQIVFDTDNRFSSLSINTSDFSAGSYYIHATINGNIITRALQIVR